MVEVAIFVDRRRERNALGGQADHPGDHPADRMVAEVVELDLQHAVGRGAGGSVVIPEVGSVVEHLREVFVVRRNDMDEVGANGRRGSGRPPEENLAEALAEREPVHACRDDVRVPVPAAVFRPDAEHAGFQNDVPDAAETIGIKIEPRAGFAARAADLDAACIAHVLLHEVVVARPGADHLLDATFRKNGPPRRRRLAEIKASTHSGRTKSRTSPAADLPRAGENGGTFGIDAHVHVGIVADRPLSVERKGRLELDAGVVGVVVAVAVRLAVVEQQPLSCGQR